MDETIVWNLIDKYFKENPGVLVEHHIASYNDFFKNDIFRIFREKEPIRLQANYDEKIDDHRNQCALYMGGKDGSKLYFGKPIVYDDANNSHYMFPNEARLRNMTYGITIHYDIEVEFTDILQDGEEPSIVNADRALDLALENDADYPSKRVFTDVKEPGQIIETEENEKMEGGAGRGRPKKIQREKRNRKPYKMTTAMSAEVRKATEDSLIGSNVQKRTIVLERVYLGKFPIMLQSDFCILKGLSPEVRFTMGECKNDLGGYFIIQGKEKTVVCQEKFADNMMYIRKYIKKDEDENDEEKQEELEYLYSAEIRSVSENVSKPIRTLAVKILAPSTTLSNRNIVVNIPNVRKPVPLFILFRALGVISDKAIIEMCLLDMEKYEHMMDSFIPSVYDAGGIVSQKLAIQYISTFVKGKRPEHVLEILSDYFLPHIGEVNFTEKAYYLGYMVFRLLSVESGLEQPTDRDNYKYKRVETIGTLMRDLFREYFTIQQDTIRVQYDRRLTYHKGMYGNDLESLIRSFQKDVLTTRIVEKGFKDAFKGSWGAKPHTKRVGILQEFNRLSFNSAMSHLRKTNLSLPASNKSPLPHLLNSSQWGYIDPIDTPDGGSIGLHKALSISTHISRGCPSREPLVQWMREKISLKYVDECTTALLAHMTKVIINGYWAGSIMDPLDCVEKMKLHRRNLLIPFDTSVTFDIKQNTIWVYNDGGRLCRPIFYKDLTTSKFPMENPEIMKLLKGGAFHWDDVVGGFNQKKIKDFKVKNTNIYELYELYSGVESESNPNKLERFIEKKAIIDYIDSSESENSLIALNYDDYVSNKGKPFTHMEIHESFLFGFMTNQIVLPENNPPARNLFSCGQSKQACSVYSTNFQNRLDKASVVLNSGQIPLVKSRYLEYFNKEEMPYGENAIVAIMCYGGYNMEDSILVNEGALKRGLFNTTYYSTYEKHEEKKDTADGIVESIFANIEDTPIVVGKKEGYDYSKLDDHGIIRENEEVTEKTVLIGQTSRAPGESVRDMSKTPKKGQLGRVDKSFMTEGEHGERIAKVRVREIRIPTLGDKMASRVGQKGTVGLVIPECDMPFTKNGVRPDLIINPHAIPSRMTIGQLVESLMGMACVTMGGFGDCTAFANKGSKIGVFGEVLTKFGYHSSGNDILYNGMTGEQLESEIFIGPTYYMRLKHMVKDKINYRARGPNTALTRQSVAGRANDGGLRIGEMERDSLISHGISNFVRESMMERADKYKMAVCNNTGMISIYNPTKNIFMSPLCDGPIRFTGSVDGNNMHIENLTKYGRNFSVVEVPYSMKLLMQELGAANIQMRIITKDNIEQLENMSFSNNIEKLVDLENIEELKGVFRNLNSKNTNNEIKEEQIQFKKEFENIASDSQEEKTFKFLPQKDSDSTPYKPESESPIITGILPAEGEVSPPYASQVQPNQIKISEKNNFEISEDVMYKLDDNKPKSLWSVTEKSPNFVTIQRKRNDGLLDTNKDIKVVRPDELYRPGDIVLNDESSIYDMGQSKSSTPQGPIMGGGSGGANGFGDLSEHQGPIQIKVNPTFVVGDNNKVEAPVEPVEPAQQQQQSCETQPIMDETGIIRPRASAPPPPVSDEEVSLNDLMSGKSFVVKKA